MKISQQWLHEWVNPGLSTDALVAQLSMSGLEVDAAVPAAPPFGQIVVGHVVELVQHPDADRLRVATVDVGQAERLQIVCGAPNVAVGMKAPTALIGATLPGGLTIKRSKLRGVESQGMLCSAVELGIAEQSDGLLPLPADSIPGADVRAVLGLDDVVIEIDLTPNRGDCLSVAGVAREVGALNGVDSKPITAAAVAPQHDATVPVTLTHPDGCPRYVGRVIHGVDARASTPLWMRERLRRAGIRSLGPLVDITNYVLTEFGQPMHAFDADKLSGGIEVRWSRAGETLELLNGDTVTLDGDTLLITDASGPVAMAGVMGGEGTACGDDTRNVFLESAFFQPEAIAGRARRYGMHTDASHRFERGVDPDLAVIAMERATALLIDIAGGTAGPVVDTRVADRMPARPAVTLRSERITRLIGRSYPDTEVEAILKRLGMHVTPAEGGWQVTPPGHRFDVEREADLIEEVARVNGYDNVPAHTPRTRQTMSARPEAHVTLARMRGSLMDRGYQEAVTYSFVDPAVQAVLDPNTEVLPLANPISADLAVMRTTIWSGLLKAVDHNRKRQQPRVRLFESGLTFRPGPDGLVQRRHLAGVACGEALPEQWASGKRAVDFFDAKGDVEALLALAGEDHRYRFVPAGHPALHPGQSACIERDGVAVGWVGTLHPRAEKALDLGTRVVVFELDLDAVTVGRLPTFQGVSKFPASRRDLAVLVPEAVSHDTVAACIRKHADPRLRELALFDVYRGQGLPDGHKSLAYGLIWQDFSENLTDQSVDVLMQAVVEGLTTIGGSLRT